MIDLGTQAAGAVTGAAGAAGGTWAGPIMLLELICGYAVCAFLGVLAATLIWMVWKNRINVSGLISEANGQASASRLQLVIFSIIIALALFLLTMKDGAFPYISPEVLLLLGISASTYAVGKGISYSQPQVMTAQGEQQTVKDISATGASAIATPGGVAATGAPNPAAPANPDGG